MSTDQTVDREQVFADVAQQINDQVAADRSPVNSGAVALAGVGPVVRELVAALEQRAEAAEALAASRLGKVLDLLAELERRDVADRIVRDEPALEAVVDGEPAILVAEVEPAGYGVGFLGPDVATTPILTHTSRTRERADHVLEFARRGDSRCAVFAIYGPLPQAADSDTAAGDQ